MSRHRLAKKDKVWLEFEKDKGLNGAVIRIIRDYGELSEIVVDFYEYGVKIFTKEEFESWQWTDNYGGTYIIHKGRV